MHGSLGSVLLVGSLLLLAAATWSVVAAWRSAGRQDHRHFVDRVVLGLLGVVALGCVLGVGLLIGGSRPADPLHLAYGAASLIALPVAIWIGARSSRADASRLRRDLWTGGGAVVLIGLGLRLIATG